MQMLNNGANELLTSSSFAWVRVRVCACGNGGDDQLSQPFLLCLLFIILFSFFISETFQKRMCLKIMFGCE